MTLSAVLGTFSQFGFHGTRSEQIAKLVGISKTNLLYHSPLKEALYIAVLRQILGIWLASLRVFRKDFALLVVIKEYIRLKLEVSRNYPQAPCLPRMEMLAGAPLLVDELTDDLKVSIDEESVLIAGQVKSDKFAPIDLQHLISMIWASTQCYADFAPQVEAVTDAMLHDEVFFNQTAENVQWIVIEGIQPR